MLYAVQPSNGSGGGDKWRSTATGAADDSDSAGPAAKRLRDLEARVRLRGLIYTFSTACMTVWLQFLVPCWHSKADCRPAIGVREDGSLSMPGVIAKECGRDEEVHNSTTAKVLQFLLVVTLSMSAHRVA